VEAPTPAATNQHAAHQPRRGHRNGRRPRARYQGRLPVCHPRPTKEIRPGTTMVPQPAAAAQLGRVSAAVVLSRGP